MLWDARVRIDMFIHSSCSYILWNHALSVTTCTPPKPYPSPSQIIQYNTLYLLEIHPRSPYFPLYSSVYCSLKLRNPRRWCLPQKSFARLSPKVHHSLPNLHVNHKITTQSNTTEVSQKEVLCIWYYANYFHAPSTLIMSATCSDINKPAIPQNPLSLLLWKEKLETTYFYPFSCPHLINSISRLWVRLLGRRGRLRENF